MKLTGFKKPEETKQCGGVHKIAADPIGEWHRVRLQNSGEGVDAARREDVGLSGVFQRN